MVAREIESLSEGSVWQANLEALANKFIVKWIEYDDIGRKCYEGFVEHVKEPYWQYTSKEEVVKYGESIFSGYTDSGLLICIRPRLDGMALLTASDGGVESDVTSNYFVLLTDVLTGRIASPPILTGRESKDGDGAKLEFTIAGDNLVRGQIDFSFNQSSCFVVNDGRRERLGAMEEIIYARYAYLQAKDYKELEGYEDA